MNMPIIDEVIFYKSLIQSHKKAYYEGVPTASDEHYDQLLIALKDAEKAKKNHDRNTS